MFLISIELVLVAVFLFVLITQIAAPLWNGTALFPSIRRFGVRHAAKEARELLEIQKEADELLELLNKLKKEKMDESNKSA